MVVFGGAGSLGCGGVWDVGYEMRVCVFLYCAHCEATTHTNKCIRANNTQTHEYQQNT